MELGMMIWGGCKLHQRVWTKPGRKMQLNGEFSA